MFSGKMLFINGLLGLALFIFSSAHAQTFSVGNASGEPGETVTVSVNFTSNPQQSVTDLFAEVEFDPDVLDYLGCSWNVPPDVEGGCDIDGNVFFGAQATEEPLPNISGQIQFRILETVTPPTSTILDIVDLSCSDFFTESQVSCSPSNGLISIIDPTPPPAPSGELTGIDFGAVPIGESGNGMATLTSTGDADLQPGNPSLPSNPGGVFNIVANNCTGASLPEGRSCTLELSCTPTEPIDYAGVLRVSTNAGPLEAPLTCTGTEIVLIAPVASILSPEGNPTITPGESVSFAGDGSSENPDADLGFSWSFDGAAPDSTQQNPGSITFNEPGSYTVTLTVTDRSNELSDTDSVVVTVEEPPVGPAPVCTIDAPSDSVTLQTGQSLAFSGRVTSAAGLATNLQWSFPGGNPSSSEAASVTVTYNQPGTFTATLSGSDAEGRACEPATRQILVQEPVLPAAGIAATTDARKPDQNGAFTVSLNTPAESSVTLSYSVGGSAQPGVDYQALPGSITLPAGQTSTTLPVNVLPGNLGGGDTTVVVTLTGSSGAPATIGPNNSATLTIRDIDAGSIELIDFAPPADAEIDSGGTVDFTAEAIVTPTGEPQFSWTFGANATPASAQGPGPHAVVYDNPDQEPFTTTVTLTVTDATNPNTPAVTATRTVTVLGKTVEQAVEEIVEIFEQLIPDLPPNQQNVLNLLANAFVTGTAGEQLTADFQTLLNAAEAGDSEVADALRRITPDQAPAPADAAFNSVEMQLANIGARLAALREGATRLFDIYGLRIDIDGQRISGRQMQGLAEALGGAASADDDGFSRLGVFVSGRLSRGTRSRTDNVEGFKYRITGLTAGADYRLRDDFVLGGALGYSSTKTDIAGRGGDLKSDGYSATLYGTWYQDRGIFVDGSLTYGRGDYTQNRNINYTLPSQNVAVDQVFGSSFKGDHIGLSVSGGYQYHRDELTLIPFARLQYLRTNIDGYRENVRNPGQPGAGWAVEIDSQRFNSLTSSLGVQGTYAISQSWGILLPFASAEWIHEFRASNRDLTGRFIDDASANRFRIELDDTDRNYFNLGLGASAQFTRGTSGFVNYQRVFGFDNLRHHSINAGLRFEF